MRAGTGNVTRRLYGVLGVAFTILVVELVGAYLARSLSLLADAGHVASDLVTVGITLVALHAARRPPTLTRSFGLLRAEVLAACVNAFVLTCLSLALLVSAAYHLVRPTSPDAAVMGVTALLALAGNGVSLLLLRRQSRGSMSVRAVYLDVVADLLGTLGVILAAGVIVLTGFTRADALVSAVIAVAILPRAWRLGRDALDVLLEATPRGVDLAAVRSHILATPGVVGVHDLHSWCIAPHQPVCSAHVVVADEVWERNDAPSVLDALSSCLEGHFALEHCTFQLEPASHADHEQELHS